MKRKINVQLMSIAALAIIITLLLVSAVFYELFQKQVFADLKTYSHIFVSTERLLNQDSMAESGEDSFLEFEIFSQDARNLRFTVIDRDGAVLYDSDADAAAMDNHKSRPEIEEAMTKGEGSIIRRSDTLDKSTFYYAVAYGDGRVLRVAREADSLFSVLFSAFPTLLFITAALLLICMAISHVLTRSLLRPIEQMAEKIDTQEKIGAYEELVPLIQTIRKQHDDILRNARMRQEFTANVSHELKTPLTSISGYSELIENGMASGEDMIRFAAEIHKNANRLLTLINDIIQLSELDSNVQEIVFEEVSLYQLAETCVDMLQMNAGKHGIALSLDGKECSIMANKQMLEEVLYNLCDNAIRYNSEGGTVRVGVYPEKDAAVLCVEDSGIGIPKEHQERIFERFYRVDKSRSKSTGGTGLGLAIVKHIVAQHGARMELESEVGKGTRIRIHFPYNAHAMVK